MSTWIAPPIEPDLEIRALAPAAHWEDAMRRVLARHGLALQGLRAEARGSDVVWGTDQAVVKLSLPRWADQLGREARFCRLAAPLPVQIPPVLAEGQLEGWPYVITGRIDGVPLDSCWPGMGPPQRAALAHDLGRVSRALHALPLPQDLADPPWTQFLAERVAQAPADQGRRGADPTLVAQMPAFLEQHVAALGLPVVVLHTELLDQHVLVDPGDPSRVTGLVDFADGQLGHPAYDLGAPIDFLFGDQPGLLAAFLRGYGPGPLDLLPAERLAGYLVHRFASLPRLLRGLSRPPHDLDELAHMAFAA